MPFEIKQYTEKEIPDVLDFERRLREEEDVWGWEIDEKYISDVKASFHDERFQNAMSLLAWAAPRWRRLCRTQIQSI